MSFDCYVILTVVPIAAAFREGRIGLRRKRGAGRVRNAHTGSLPSGMQGQCSMRRNGTVQMEEFPEQRNARFLERSITENVVRPQRHCVDVLSVRRLSRPSLQVR